MGQAEDEDEHVVEQTDPGSKLDYQGLDEVDAVVRQVQLP